MAMLLQEMAASLMQPGTATEPLLSAGVLL